MEAGKTQIFLGYLLFGLVSSGESQTPTSIRKAGEPMSDAKLESILRFVLPTAYLDRQSNSLPREMNNADSVYFGPVGTWSQQGVSCGNAQAVSVAFNFEANRARKFTTPEDALEPMYPYEYTYHFLNNGDMSNGGDGWMFVEAFDILKETGAPTSGDFGGFEWGNSFNGWMSGYEKYYRAMHIRLSNYYQIDAQLPSSKEAIKQILVDHANGSQLGANLVFLAPRSQKIRKEWIDGRLCFTQFDSIGEHAVTIVGYDDDFLPERGGSWIVHNSFGDGLYYMPRDLLGSGSILTSPKGIPVMFPRIIENYAPKLTLKITLTHNQRGNIAIMTGFANSASATRPDMTKDYAGAFNFSGGLNPMVGKNQASTIEIGLDLTDFAPRLTGSDVRFFLAVVSKGGTGTIDKVTLMDYTGWQVKETPAGEAHKPIAQNATTWISIPWSAPTSTGIRARSEPFQPGVVWSKGGGIRIKLTESAATRATLQLRDLKGRPVYGSVIGLAGQAANYADFTWDGTGSR